MAHSLLALVIQCQSNVTQSASSSNNSGVCFRVHGNVVEPSQINDQVTVFASETMSTITMTA